MALDPVKVNNGRDFALGRKSKCKHGKLEFFHIMAALCRAFEGGIAEGDVIQMDVHLYPL